ncbi:RrF2 family transcriptional regulator [Pseudonocardia sp.]|uniref:RrF2 family transcriptional regulator n=1 Tax=Pseudonocardia sp. TaxID=60912 RepID=UPI003D0C8332
MKHTNHADYALRVLMYLRVAPGRRGSIAGIAAAHRISRHHLDKVVRRMAAAGLVQTTRGRGGGVQLTRRPDGISLGDVMRAMEDDFAVVECLGAARFCRIAGVCGARSVFARALDSYFAVLDGATLDDLAANDLGLRGALGLSGNPVRSNASPPVGEEAHVERGAAGAGR